MEDDDYSEHRESSRRGSSGVTIKSPPSFERKYDFSRNVDEGYHSLSGSSISSHRLHGERPLAQRNVENASQAYDNKLLSKIGKPKTPPPALRTASVDAASPSSSLQQHYQNGRNPHQLKSLSISEGTTNSYPNSPFKRGTLSGNSAESPRSRAISPSLLSSAASAKSFMDWRNPTWDSSAPTSAVSDTQSRPPQSRFGSFSSQYQQQRKLSRRRSNFSNYDESAEASLVSEDASRGAKRGSQDQSTLTEPDTNPDFPYMEETGAMRQLHLEDRAPLSLDPALQQYSSSPVVSSDPQPGKKRRASSPPPDSSHDDKAPSQSAGSSSDLYQRNNQAPTHPPNRASPVNRFGPQHGSVSSASSVGLRNGSYASSGALSVGSSLTSHSPNHERLSPTSEYPYPQSHPERDSPYITSHPSPRSSVSHAHPHPAPTKSSAASSRKMSSDGASSRRANNPPNLQAPICCQCCPKKPKKFETLEELRAHESEKQYVCNYCHNRFKNKNEAERHQNSLHVRRYSWSCATLAGVYQRVFHSATNIPPQQHPNQAPSPDMIAAADICGYCGQEFPSNPQPEDWNERIAHLTNVHKFGECNQSKKFFRADHFRQHLKHSHGGASGKWTNELERECMKEEPVPDVMPQPMQVQQSMQQPMQQPLQQQMHQMQGMQPGPSMHHVLGGAPVANMGMMPGSVPGQPMNIMGSTDLRDETIDELKHEM
ncbi:MAG: hypothetical protein Q9218_004598 [Villophora microphyllina]